MGCIRNASSTVAFGAACCMSLLGIGLLAVAVVAGGWLTPRLAEKTLTTERAKIALDTRELEQSRAGHARCADEAGALRRDVAALQRDLQALKTESAAEIDALKLGSAADIDALKRSVAELRALVRKPAAELGPPPSEGAGGEGSGLGDNPSASSEAKAAVVKRDAAGDLLASDEAGAVLGTDGKVFVWGPPAKAQQKHSVRIRRSLPMSSSRRLGKHTFGLWRSDMRCLSSGKDDEKELGQKDSVDACHEACVKEAQLGNESCNFFLYGSDDGACRWETDSACVSGELEELKTYNIYKVNGIFLAEYRRGADKHIYKHCNESLSRNGADYRGCQDRTLSGLKCQRWASQVPHYHKYKLSSESSNYCRNPPPVGSTDFIWCFTQDTDVRWERCAPRSLFLKNAGVNIEDPQPQELFVAIEIALERNDPTLLWRDSHDARTRHKLIGCLRKLDYRKYHRAPAEAQYAFLGAATAWFGNLTDLTQGVTNWDTDVNISIAQHPLLTLLAMKMLLYEFGPDVPDTWLSNWKLLDGCSDLQVRKSAWKDVIHWAKELTGGDEIRAALVSLFPELAVDIVQFIPVAELREWDELMVARRWADAMRHYNISGACDGHKLQQDIDYHHVFGMSSVDRRKVLEFRIGGKTMLLAAVSNCECLCTCNGDAPRHEMCSHVIQDLVSHYKVEKVAIDTTEDETCYTAAMLAARSGGREATRMLRYAMLEQGYRDFEKGVGTKLYLLHIADFCSINTMLVFTGCLAFATVCFKVLYEDFTWKHPFRYNTGTLLRLLVLLGINLTIKYACDVLPLLCSNEGDKLVKLALTLETPWNVSTKAINVSICIIAVISSVGCVLDVNCSQLSQASADAIQPTDIYQDPRFSVSKCFMRMTGASCLFIIYLSYFTTPVSMTLAGRCYWLLAILVQVKLAIPGDGSHGSTLSQWVRSSTKDMRNPELWAVLYSGKDLQEQGKEKRIFAPSIYEVYMRQFFSFVSSAVFRSVIIYTLPLYLASSTVKPIDFALNACALTYIYTYGELSEIRTYEVLDKDVSNDQSDSSDVSDCDSEQEKLAHKPH